MTFRPFLGVALAVVLSGSSHSDGAPTRFGAIRTLTSPASPGSAEPNLSINNGKVYLSWIEMAPDSGHMLRYSMLQGARFTPARTIATGPKGAWFVNWADFPSLLVTNNQMVAHWLERSGSGRYAYGVRVARSRDGGKTWSKPVTPHRDTTQSEHGFVSLFTVGNEVGIAWLDGRKHATAKNEVDAEMSVRFTTLTPRDGFTADRAIDERVCDCCQTSAAITAKGPVLVYRDRSAKEVRDIAIVRYSNGAWSAPRLVHDDNWVIAACPVNGPSVSARGEDVAVAWFTAANEQARVHVAFSRDAGSTFRAPIRVDDGNAAGRVDVQYLNDRSALVSWLERVGDKAEVRVRRVYADGRRSESKTVVTSTSERASGFPHMIWRGADVVFAWTEPGRPAHVKTALLELK